MFSLPIVLAIDSVFCVVERLSSVSSLVVVEGFFVLYFLDFFVVGCFALAAGVLAIISGTVAGAVVDSNFGC